MFKLGYEDKKGDETEIEGKEEERGREQEDDGEREMKEKTKYKIRRDRTTMKTRYGGTTCLFA